MPTRWDDLEEQALGFGPLLLVCAPAGYGKSIALAEWIEADSRPGVWLQLDAADNDPVVLLGYLALALAQVTSAF